MRVWRGWWPAGPREIGRRALQSKAPRRWVGGAWGGAGRADRPPAAPAAGGPPQHAGERAEGQGVSNSFEHCLGQHCFYHSNDLGRLALDQGSCTAWGGCFLFLSLLSSSSGESEPGISHQNDTNTGDLAQLGMVDKCTPNLEQRHSLL